MKIFGIVIAVIFVIVVFSLIGNYNSLVSKDETVTGNWGQVENQYQRRNDLIPNLMNTVKGYATHEKSTFVEVTDARAKVNNIQINAGQLTKDEGMMKQFIEAQDQLGGALSRLMVVVEKYPDLKANQNFISLQDELAGTENRIAVSRKTYNESVVDLNKDIRVFPSNIVASVARIEKRAYFAAEEKAKTAPVVDFSER
ncbi:MAG TPA: LemA family protein [Candidatus Nanoarchaeia archaeon]|nr:LemA family protein [Candidatus Nanoarchaeia archaeon]